MIHVPSATAPRLTYAKSARNVENFLSACRRIGVPPEDAVAQNVILEGKSPEKIARTVDETVAELWAEHAHYSQQ